VASLQLVRTDIAGFVGVAQRGPLPDDFPAGQQAQAVLQINSWKQFLTSFGSFIEYGYLAYAVRAFFENGGKECHIARVAATTSTDYTQWPRSAFLTLPSEAATPIGTISQVTDGFQCSFQLTASHAPAAGDLLLLTGGGVTQLVPVTTILPNGQALMASSIQVQAKASVSWFPAACTICAASRGNWGNNLLIQIKNSKDAPLNRVLHFTVCLLKPPPFDACLLWLLR